MTDKDILISDLNDISEILNNNGYGGWCATILKAVTLLKEHDTVEHALDILRKHGWKETEDVPYANEQERHPVIVCPHCGKRVK